MIEHWINPAVVQRMAGSLLHFFWQGSLLAILAAVLLRLLARKTAQTRYLVSVIALLLMLIAPMLTFLFYAETGKITLLIIRFIDESISASGSNPLRVVETAVWAQWIVLIWGGGVAFCAIRLIASWRLSQRLRRFAVAAVPALIVAMFGQIREELARGRRIALLLSEYIDTPVVVGWLRPVVLLPLSAVTGLNEDQLRAVLAHELAHVRRHDFLVNMLQSCVESILFYHPAVWWLSARIRIERENCCDDLAVQVCGDRLLYAQALIELERNRAAVPTLALAATRNGLTLRIQRILGRESNSRSRDWQSAAAALAFVLVWMLAGAWQSSRLNGSTMTPPTLRMATIVPEVTVPSTSVAKALQSIAAIVSAQPVSVASQSASQDLSVIGQDAQVVKASIDGVVLIAGTEAPLSGAHVTLTRNAQASTSNATILPSATTDSLGHFALNSLDPGAYRLTIASNGFIKQEYGQRAFPGQGAVLSLRAGDTLKNLVAHLSPTGNVGGRIRDAQGNPAVDVPVQIFRNAYRADGTKGLQLLGGTKTDDRGEYRFYWLTPDTYFIYAGGPMSGPGAVDRTSLIRSVAAGGTAPTNKVTDTYRAAFYRNALELKDAIPIRIQSGDDVGGIDFTTSPRVLAGIHGRIIDTGAGTFPNAADVTVQSWSPDGKLNTYSARSYYSADKGTFDIPDLSPGPYTIAVARTGTPASRGSTSVTLGNADLNGVLVQISPPFSISGHVAFDNPAPANAIFELRPVAGIVDRITGTMSRDGFLKIDNVPPGDYWLVCTSPTHFVQTAQYGTDDVLDHPLHFTGTGTATLNIALSSKGSEVRGVTHSEKGPSIGSTVVLVPNWLRERADLYKTTTTDQNGGFTLTNVPPGDYTIFVWEAIEQYAWFDPDLLARLEASSGLGKTIHISESSQESIDLRTIAAGEQR